MKLLNRKSFSLGWILNSTGLMFLVLLWIIPTIGLFVSSFRDKDQLAITGWWTAFSTTEKNEFRRTGTQEEQFERNGKNIISGKLTNLEGKKIKTFSANFRNPNAHKAGNIAKFKDGSLFTLKEDGNYEWISDVPFKHERGKRIFYVASVPPSFSLDNYYEVLASEEVGQSFINTLKVTIPATVIPIMIAAFAAYAFAWMEFPGRRFIFVSVVGLLVVPLQMSLIPLLSIYNEIGNYLGVAAKSYPGIWLAHTGFGLPLAIYLLRNYMGNIPREIIESARIDGASHFQIFTHLVIPLSVPALASFCIFQFLWVWNDLLVALVFLGKQDKQIVLTSKLRELLGSRGDNWEILTSSAFISIVVPLIVFFTLQRYFVRGLVTGSVKA